MEKKVNYKITVGIVTFNRPDFLKEAVYSILQQSFSEFELIISNDYVETEVTFESLGIEYDSRIKIINQKVNLGEMKNLNYLLEIAIGEWFVWLADDDLFHPEFLMLAYDAIHKGNATKKVAFYSNYISAKNSLDIFPQPLISNKCDYYEAERFLLDYSARKINLIGCYGVVRTSALRQIGGMPHLGNSFGPYSDTLVPMLLVKYGEICWLNEDLVFFRSHSGSLSNNSVEFTAFATAEVDFLAKINHIYQDGLLAQTQERVIANMVRWFSTFEWAVLERNPNINVFELTFNFIRYQINVNFPRLSLSSKTVYVVFLANFIYKSLTSIAYKFIRRCVRLGYSFFYFKSTNKS